MNDLRRPTRMDHCKYNQYDERIVLHAYWNHYPRNYAVRREPRVSIYTCRHRLLILKAIILLSVLFFFYFFFIWSASSRHMNDKADACVLRLTKEDIPLTASNQISPENICCTPCLWQIRITMIIVKGTLLQCLLFLAHQTRLDLADRKQDISLTDSSCDEESLWKRASVGVIDHRYHIKLASVY